MFWLWRRMEEADRPRVWVLYGWFSGLMCVGSVFGAVTWVAWMQYLVFELRAVTKFVGDTTPFEFQSLAAQFQYWYAAFCVTYAIEFLCLSVAKLLVLHRMMDVILTLNRIRLRPDVDNADFAVPKGDGLSRRLAVGGRIVMAAVVVGNVVGLCGYVAAAVGAKEAGDLNNAAAVAYARNDTDSYNKYYSQANLKTSALSKAASVQQFCEVVVLLIIIFAFAIVGIASARRVSSALRHMNDEHVEAAGRQLRRQIVGTTAFVFLTFLLRAVFSIMNAVSDALQDYGAACAATDLDACDPSCYNIYTIMQNWLEFTPEFQLIVELISSPLTLLVALWGMTSKHMLQTMKRSRRQMTAMIDGRQPAAHEQVGP